MAVAKCIGFVLYCFCHFGVGSILCNWNLCSSGRGDELWGRLLWCICWSEAEYWKTSKSKKRSLGKWALSATRSTNLQPCRYVCCLKGWGITIALLTPPHFIVSMTAMTPPFNTVNQFNLLNHSSFSSLSYTITLDICTDFTVQLLISSLLIHYLQSLRSSWSHRSYGS